MTEPDGDSRHIMWLLRSQSTDQSKSISERQSTSLDHLTSSYLNTTNRPISRLRLKLLASKERSRKWSSP